MLTPDEYKGYEQVTADDIKIKTRRPWGDPRNARVVYIDAPQQDLRRANRARRRSGDGLALHEENTMIVAHSERWDFCKHHPDGISADEGCQKCEDERADERANAVTVVSSDEDGVVTFDSQSMTPEDVAWRNYRAGKGML